MAMGPLTSPSFVKIHAEAYILTLEQLVSSNVLDPYDEGGLPVNTRLWQPRAHSFSSKTGVLELRTIPRFEAS